VERARIRIAAVSLPEETVLKQPGSFHTFENLPDRNGRRLAHGSNRCPGRVQPREGPSQTSRSRCGHRAEGTAPLFRRALTATSVRAAALPSPRKSSIIATAPIAPSAAPPEVALLRLHVAPLKRAVKAAPIKAGSFFFSELWRVLCQRTPRFLLHFRCGSMASAGPPERMAGRR
jgi:hypothetical protein